MDEKDKQQEYERRDGDKADKMEIHEEDSIQEHIKKAIDKEGGSDKNAPFVIQNLNLIIHNDGIVTGDNASVKDVDIHEDNHVCKEYEQVQNEGEGCFIENLDELKSWMTKHYNDYEMAFIITMAVFEKMPYLWVYEMAESLFALLGGTNEEFLSVKAKMANSNRIENVGGKTYLGIVYNHTGKMENMFICFQNADYSKRVLECVWKEYIFLREKIIEWLAKYISDQNYSKAIRAIKALALFAQVDFDYFCRKVITKLFSRKDLLSDFAIAQIMLQVYQNEKYQDNIEKAYMHWTKMDNIHYLFTALMIGVANKWNQGKMEIAVERYIDRLIWDIRSCTTEEYISNLPAFFAIGQRTAVYFKAITEVLHEKLKMYQGRKHRLERVCIGISFLLLLSEDNNQSNIDFKNAEKHKEMIFVKMCLISNDTTMKVRELWRLIWTDRELHGTTKAFIEQYLYQYGGCNQQQIAYLKKFLYSFQTTETERNNMDYFLKRISLQTIRPVRTAERISHEL